MSLIFQSLQKLNPDLKESASGADSCAPVSDRAARKLLMWLRPVLIGLAFVLALGCGVVYAVQYLKDHVPLEMAAAAPAQQKKHAVPPIAQPSAPGAAAEPKNASAAQSPAAQLAAAKPVNAQTQYYPPTSAKDSSDLATLAFVQAREQDSATQAAKVATQVDSVAAAANPKTGISVTERTAQVDTPVLEAAESARRAALEKSARIGRLVRRIEEALAGGPNAGDAQRLLNELARIKGQNHPYVAKMRAYWNAKRGHYDAAEADLKKVIAAVPDDLEAGINLALIEIHAQRYQEALIRLKRLRNAYPENSLIADMIKRLK